MKKVSTAATKQSRNISQQQLTIGLDLGDRNSWYCVLDEAGQIQAEQRVRTTAKALLEVFGVMPRSRIALEIGRHSPWISRLLKELGHEVIVANARKVRLIGENVGTDGTFLDPSSCRLSTPSAAFDATLRKLHLKPFSPLALNLFHIPFVTSALVFHNQIPQSSRRP
ncbi:MAG TPA: hypothetical protein VMX38_12040 [Verrucomicrobiae bacterium]|jgi:hypothetical protein|nr:hypothetical protein [Verrucomicrobiae bacterium]